jgi:site-specific recombinase XerD
MVARAGEAAGFPFLVHSHMLRHSCGYKLANDGQDTRAIQHYLGLNSTVRYTALAPDRLKGFWKDYVSPARPEMGRSDMMGKFPLWQRPSPIVRT